jgi:hypothetical protein
LKLGQELARLKSADVDEVHFHFLQVFTWFFFPDASGRCLEEYRQFNPEIYDAACGAQEEARQVGTSTAVAHRQFLSVFMRHWREFCNANLWCTERGRRLLRLLEESRFECIREKVNGRSEHFIGDYLRQTGLV